MVVSVVEKTIQDAEKIVQLVDLHHMYQTLDVRALPSNKWTMATTIEQQVAMDEALATAYVHQHSIRFKMNNKKHIVNLESFRDMLHISPRIPGQSFDELPFEEEILKFIRYLGHSAKIRTLTDEDFVYQVAHKNHKKSNEMYYPRFTKVIIHHFISKDPSILMRNKYGAMLPIELTNDEIRNTKAYKEYYAFATGEAVPKPKASARRKRSDSDTSITPPTATLTPKPTIAATPRLTVTAKGKQPVKATEAKSLSALSEYGCSGTDEGTSSKPGVPNVPTIESEEELSWNSSDDEGADDQGKDGDDDEGDKGDESDKGEEDADEDKDSGDDEEKGESNEEDDNKETRDEESFDPIPKTPESSKDEGDGEEDQVRVAVQIQTDRLHDSYQRENDEFLRTIDENIKRIIKEQVKGQVKEQVSKILPGIEQSVNAQLEAEVLTRSSHSSRTSYAVAADLSEMEPKKILIEKMEGNKRDDDDDDKDEEPSAGSDRGSKRRREGKEPESASAPLETVTRSTGKSTTGSKSRQASASESAFAEEPMQTTSQIEEPSHSVFETGAEDQPIIQSSQHPEWFSQPQKPLTPDRDWNKTLPAVQRSTQTWISELAKQADSRSSFNELLNTPLDFSNFIMNRLRVDTLTPELLARPTYGLMKGSCTSPIELEYHLEEVYKATTDQLDWVNPEGQQYPHNLLQPLPLILDNRGRRVIPFAHFINNDLEHLRGGVSHWGSKRQQFYDFAFNWESALDVYSKSKIIAVTDLKIVEWHSYKHLDWISVRHDDHKIYKLKEGDFKRLRLQDIEDMLLLLVQGKLSNLTVEEHLQLGVKSYQKRLNLTKPDTYRSDLKRMEAYTTYSNPRGFIYQNKDKKNRLMRIDELHKFSDGTLNDVRTALDDHAQDKEDYEEPGKVRWKETSRCCKGPYDSSYAALVFKEEKSEKLGKVPTEMELILEHTQQGISYEVSVTPTKPGRMTKPYSSHRFIANCFNAGNIKMEGLRNANHTQTLDLADIYRRFVYKENLIQRRISKKILMIRILYCMICKKEDYKTLNREMYTASLKRSENYKARPYQYASPSKQILKEKANPFPPCTHCGFNDRIPYDCRNYPECEIYGSYDHFTSGHNRVFHIRGGVLAESYQSSESSISVKCNTCGNTAHSTTNHNEFDHFKRACEKRNHYRASFKTKQNFSIKKCLHLLHMDLFGPVSPMSINHEKYILVIIDEYSRVFNTRRQKVKETYQVTFDENMEAIMFINTLVDEIGIDDSSRYPLDEFIHKDDPSRQYQVNYDISYYVIPHGRLLTKLTQENHVHEVIALNEHETPYIVDAEGLSNLINTEGSHEQNVQDEQIITKPTKGPSGSMATKLIAASASKCLFVDFLSELEPKKVSEALKHPRWVDVMQEELNKFYRNKSNPMESHLTTMKRILRKSTSGAFQILGGKLVCWSAKKQQSVAMSSVEAEYVVAAGCCVSILWMKSQLSDYDIDYKMVSIFCDNTSAIAISNNPCTAIATHPNPPTDDYEVRPLKEYAIKFLVMNGKKPLTLDFKTFTESTRLDYAKDAYVSHPSPEVVKAELAKIVENPILLDRMPDIC
nr:hypothetical protein [Tanacetum cinerariifolium]